MNKLPFALIILFVPAICIAQKGKLIPPKTKIKDNSLVVFIDKLEKAVEQKDKDFIVESLSKTVQCSFGCDDGIESFKNYYLENKKNEFWGVMNEILAQGGAYIGEDLYSFPYVYTNWPDKYDAFEYYAITGNRVNVRDKPNLKSSRVLGQLTYDIVTVDWDKSAPADGELDHEKKDWVGARKWYYVKQAEGKLEGFVYWDYVYSPIGYRIGLKKLDGIWKITFFVAGD